MFDGDGRFVPRREVAPRRAFGFDERDSQAVRIDERQHALPEARLDRVGRDAVPLEAAAFGRGSLQVRSYARPGKLFTASADLIVSEVGTLTPDALARIVDAIVPPLRAGRPT